MSLLGIRAVSALGLPVTWDVIRLGWEGVGGERRLLSLDDVRAFADQEVGTASEAELADVADLCTVRDEPDVKEPLERLAPRPSVSALRIWRAVLLDRILQTPYESPIATLTDLTMFWAGFGFPPESPHVVQGLSNRVSPEGYYTEQTAARTRDQHLRWLDQEIASLRAWSKEHD